jgi:subtilisin family serine protease
VDTPLPGARTTVVQARPGWGLDRIGQRALPLDGTFRAAANGRGVTVYTVDTGLAAGNPAFGGRASLVTGFTPKQPPAGYAEEDGSGVLHGTFVAGVIAGARTGVARQAKVVVVQGFCCSYAEPDQTPEQQQASVVRSIDWITAHAAPPAVVNLSLSYPGRVPAVDAAVRRLLARGIPVVAAAGNAGADACQNSPAPVLGVLVVAASTPDDRPDPVSNLGRCVNLFAPGHDITSLRGSDPTPYRYADVGATSWATPYVSGAIALYLSLHPSATVAQVRAWVLSTATKGALTGVPAGTPNRLLYLGDL